MVSLGTSGVFPHSHFLAKEVISFVTVNPPGSCYSTSCSSSVPFLSCQEEEMCIEDAKNNALIKGLLYFFNSVKAIPSNMCAVTHIAGDITIIFDLILFSQQLIVSLEQTCGLMFVSAYSRVRAVNLQ